MLWQQMALSFGICLVNANMVKSIGKDAAKFGLLSLERCGYVE